MEHSSAQQQPTMFDFAESSLPPSDNAAKTLNIIASARGNRSRRTRLMELAMNDPEALMKRGVIPQIIVKYGPMIWGLNALPGDEPTMQGWPSHIGRAVVFCFRGTIPLGGTSTPFVLRPPQSIQVLALISPTDTLSDQHALFASFDWAGSPIYPIGGEESVGVVQSPNRYSDFNPEVNKAGVLPMPGVLLPVNSRKGLSWSYNAPTAISDIQVANYVFAVSGNPRESGAALLSRLRAADLTDAGGDYSEDY